MDCNYEEYMENQGARCVCGAPCEIAGWCRDCFDPHPSLLPPEGASGYSDATVNSTPECGHSACSQNWIDTGETGCVLGCNCGASPADHVPNGVHCRGATP